jgi:hypothetical protein
MRLFMWMERTAQQFLIAMIEHSALAFQEYTCSCCTTKRSISNLAKLLAAGLAGARIASWSQLC